MLNGVVNQPAPNGIGAKTNLFDGKLSVNAGTQNDIFD